MLRSLNFAQFLVKKKLLVSFQVRFLNCASSCQSDKTCWRKTMHVFWSEGEERQVKNALQRSALRIKEGKEPSKEVKSFLRDKLGERHFNAAIAALKKYYANRPYLKLR
jgi:hypothetical protein